MMSFWIKIDVCEKGDVVATTYENGASGYPQNRLRERRAATVSQALRSMAAAMVKAKAETLAQQQGKVPPE